MPTCWVIAGPNGAGKTTFAMEYLPDVAGCAHFINADLIAAGLSPFAPEREMLAASRIFLRELAERVQARDNFAFETTLSGRSYLKLVDRLMQQGWRVELIYLALPNLQMSKLRVAERVRHGGHHVSAADLERRFSRSLQHLLNDFSWRVSHCRCFMNAGDHPALVFEQSGMERRVIHAEYYHSLLEVQS
jgi:predicted ABC-type ATPase